MDAGFALRGIGRYRSGRVGGELERGGAVGGVASGAGDCCVGAGPAGGVLLDGGLVGGDEVGGVSGPCQLVDPADRVATDGAAGAVGVVAGRLGIVDLAEFAVGSVPGVVDGEAVDAVRF